jgi:23S rRNA (uridine2552-2'-O)-methyltransferase
VLHRRGFCPGANLLENAPAVFALGLDPDLDQLMGCDCTLDFRQHRPGQALVADEHHRLQAMRAGLEGAFFLRRRIIHAHTLSHTMARTKSSKAWLKRHLSDPYVQKAKAQGYRSRAAFKLEQIDAKDRLFKAGARVVDLGAAPGGWSQLAASRVGPKGLVVAVDLLETAPMSGVTVLRGDFRSPVVREAVRTALGKVRADVVLSDMLPNVSGIPAVDQANAATLTEVAIDFCLKELKPDGVFVVKVFQGEAFQGLLGEMKKAFRTVVARKPDASRGESREMYLVGRGLRLAQAQQDSD